MIRHAFCSVFMVCALPCFPQKAALNDSIDKRADAAWKAALRIWEWAEPGYQETESADLLASMLDKAGFDATRGVAGIPTAFTAEYGSGRPIIGILGEYDALPGLAQEAVPRQAQREGNGYGHGCGHHLLGVAAAAASIAIAEQIKKGEMPGTVRFYGTPAEEGGSAKTFMTRAGLFDDCDVVLHWHPDDLNSAGDPTNLARIGVKFRFRGVSAHAAAAPEQGRSALDAVELTNFAAELMREHTPEGTRIHHVITAGGGAPNVVPDFAEVFYYVRHPDAGILRGLYERLHDCAKAGALGTGTELQTKYLGGVHNILPNDALAAVTMRNLLELAHLEYTPEERAFAESIQSTLTAAKPIESIREVKNVSGEISKGSTDVGDVSWVVPVTGFTTACWAPGTPAHSWQATACGATSIGRKGMILAAKVLAATAWDLVHSPEIIAVARKEHEDRLAGHPYEALLEANQPPPLDYRNRPE